MKSNIIDEIPNIAVTDGGLVYNLNTGKRLKQAIDKYGYNQVSVWSKKLKKIKSYKVHRLVALAFIENKDSLVTVNHKNSNKLDNRAYNLEWLSSGDNTRHWIKNNPKQVSLRLEKISKAKSKRISCIELDKEWKSAKSASIELDLNVGSIQNSARLGTKLKGFSFSYIPLVK